MVQDSATEERDNRINAQIGILLKGAERKKKVKQQTGCGGSNEV